MIDSLFTTAMQNSFKSLTDSVNNVNESIKELTKAVNNINIQGGLENMKKIEVKYLTDITPLEQKKGGDWIDLRAAETVELHTGVHKLIPLGIAMKLPEGFEAIMAPRSSAFKKYGFLVANSIGVIDES